MKRATRFTLAPGWNLLLKDMQIDIQSVLTHAGLPLDLFNRVPINLSPQEYFELWQGMEFAAKDRELPLLLAKHMSTEMFDAPLFAAVCSQNLAQALVRIQAYKPLIGPMEMHLKQTPEYTRLQLSCYGNSGALPRTMELCELVFFTQIARLCTREHIQPQGVTLSSLPDIPCDYEAYFGCPLTLSDTISLTFSSKDCNKPFLTANANMWSFFEGKLNQTLMDMQAQATTTERVRAVLLEALPSGESSIEVVAARLAMTKRTLQRKLAAESQNYKLLLQTLRTELAEHYLEKSRLGLNEIAFLLGFKEPNSFIRAYTQWKGIGPGQYRTATHSS